MNCIDFKLLWRYLSVNQKVNITVLHFSDWARYYRNTASDNEVSVFLKIATEILWSGSSKSS